MELSKLIEVQNSSMGQTDFPGPNRPTTPNQSGCRGPMMRVTKWSDARQQVISRYAGDRMDTQGFLQLRLVNGWKNGIHTAGKHGLTRARRTYHEHAKTARCGNGQSALRELLTNNIGVVEHRPIFRHGRRAVEISTRLQHAQSERR